MRSEPMTREEALERMVPPWHRRPRKRHGGVIQIWVTRVCDKSCFGCTQGSNLRGAREFMTADQFGIACKSLEGYFGTVGMFGGNPTLHPQFEDLCAVMREHVPRERRGLWASAPNGKGQCCRQTFSPSASNINVHLDREAYAEWRRDWPECRPVGLSQDSRHGPPYVAMQDVISDEEERWDLIAGCDVNQHWSAMICVFRGELRAFFCEIAGAQAMLHQHEPDYPDLGLPVDLSWWKSHVETFGRQIDYHCHACGVPLRGYGELAQAGDGVEQVSETHRPVYVSKVPNRRVELVTDRIQLGQRRVGRFIDYLQNASR